MLIIVLKQVEEEIRELEARLYQPYSSEACKSLARQPQASLATAVSMAKLLNQREKTASESPLLATESLQRENSEKDFKEQGRKEAFKKRYRNIAKCSNSDAVKVINCLNFEGRRCQGGPSWRKDGQKEILGSKFPRSIVILKTISI